MLWAILSVLAALLWAMTNIVDKLVLEKFVKNSFVPVIMYGLVSLIVGALIWIFVGIQPLSTVNIVLAGVAAALQVLMVVFYFKAMQIEEASRVIPLFYLGPLFVSVFAAIILGEVFGAPVYAGMVLLVIGSILITVKKMKRIDMGKAFFFMMLATIATSLSSVITKYLLGFADYWSIFTYLRIGAFLGSIPIAYFFLGDFLKTIKAHGMKAVGAMALSESLNVVGVFTFTVATSLGFVTLTNALSSVQPFFVLVFTVILSAFFPKILKEDIGKSTVILKFVAIALMFVGAMMIM